MITINIKTGAHPVEEIRQRILNYFKNTTNPEANTDEFLTAMEITGQLKRKKNKYITSQKPGRTTKKEITETLPTISAGGRERVGIHLKPEWEQKHGHPVTVYLTAVRETPIKPVRLKEITPRPSEAWRTEIPTDIRKKYNIKKGEPVTITITSTKKTGWQPLKLWGYSFTPTVTFEYNKTRRGMRTMELKITDIPFEIHHDIIAEKENAITKGTTLMRNWLKKFDPQYGSFFEEPSMEKIWGTPTSPMTKKPEIKPTIEFTDIDKGITIAQATAELTENWTQQTIDTLIEDFTTTIDLVAHGIKSIYGRAERYIEGF